MCSTGLHIAKQELIVVEKDDEAELGVPSTSTQQPSKPKGLFPTGKKIKSFADFRKAKGKQWKKSVSPKNSDERRSKEREVCINIGLLEWNYKENVLKPKRGKKLVLRTSNKVNYKTLCNKAVEKWKAFYSHLYVESNEYVLLYENGEEALFLPGSKKEFLALKGINKNWEKILTESLYFYVHPLTTVFPKVWMIVMTF